MGKTSAAIGSWPLAFGLFSRRFSRGCSSKQFREPALWAEQIPLLLRARIFPHSYAALRNVGPSFAPTRAKAKTRVSGAPVRTRARFTLCRNSKGLRVWVGTIRMSIGIHVSIAALPCCATRAVAHPDVTRRMLLARHSRGRLYC